MVFIHKNNMEENTEIAVRKSMPKFLSLLMIMNEKAEEYGDLDRAYSEVESRVPEGLMELVMDVKAQLMKGINSKKDAFEKGNERIDGYLQRMDIDSLEVAEAVVDPSLERVDAIANDVTQILGRYIGANPLPVLKGKIPFNIYHPFGSLEDDVCLDRRISDVKHILAKEGKTLDDTSNMSLEDILKVREQVQQRKVSLERRELLEEQVAEKYVEYMINLSQQLTPEATAKIPEMEQFSALIQDNLPDDIPDSESAELRKYLSGGGLNEIASLQSRMAALTVAKQFINCSIDVDYLNLMGNLAQIGGVNILIDNEVRHVSPLDYVALSRQDLATLKKVKNYLVDIAEERGLDAAVKPETLNEGLRFAYGGDKDSYIAHQRYKLRVEGVLAQSIMEGRSVNGEELATNPVYQATTEMIDKQVYKMADSIFGVEL